MNDSSPESNPITASIPNLQEESNLSIFYIRVLTFLLMLAFVIFNGSVRYWFRIYDSDGALYGGNPGTQ